MEQTLTNQGGSQRINTNIPSFSQATNPEAFLNLVLMIHLPLLNWDQFNDMPLDLSSSSCFLSWTSRSPAMGWGHLLHVQTPLQVWHWELPAGPDISASHQTLSEARGGKNAIYWQSLRTSQEAEKLPSL